MKFHVLGIDLLQQLVGMGRMPDVAHDGLTAEEGIIFISDIGERALQGRSVGHLRQFLFDAPPALLVEALGQCADDRGLVGEILVESAERKTGLFDDLAHLQTVAAMAFDQLRGNREDLFEALAAALLAGDAARLAGRLLLTPARCDRLFRHDLSFSTLTNKIREIISFCK